MLPLLLLLLLLLLVVGLNVQLAHCLHHKHGNGHSCLHVYVCCRYCCCCFCWLASMSNLRTACSTNTAMARTVKNYYGITQVVVQLKQRLRKQTRCCGTMHAGYPCHQAVSTLQPRRRPLRTASLMQYIHTYRICTVITGGVTKIPDSQV